MKFVSGSDGYPAFNLTDRTNIAVDAISLLPQTLVGDFALLVSTKPSNQYGGYLFAVVNPLDTVVQFGIYLSHVIDSHMDISLYYTDSTKSDETVTIARFKVPEFTKRWTKLAIKVKEDKISLFLDCDVESEYVISDRLPDLTLEEGSTLYLAQAGPVLSGRYVVSIQGHTMTLNFNHNFSGFVIFSAL